MLHLLLGEDDLSKQAYLVQLSKLNGLAVIKANSAFGIEQLSSVDLFGQPRIYVFAEVFSDFNQPDVIERLIVSKNQAVFLEKKLDKRLTVNKKLLADQRVVVREYALPQGNELINWIIQRTEALGGKISFGAARILAEILGLELTAGFGREDSLKIDLWLADSELQKLTTLALGREITEKDIYDICPEYREVQVFELTNAIAEADRAKALKLMEGYFRDLGSAKEPVMILNALLAEQFRNALAVKDFLAHRQSDANIIQATGWKSGRLFVMKKVAARFSREKMLDLLRKLQALDAELKTSLTPPKVLFTLILANFSPTETVD